MAVVRITQQHNEDRLEGTLTQLTRGAAPLKLRVYDAPMPASPNDPPTTPLVAEFTFIDPPGSVSANKLTFTLPPNAVILVNDNIRWARFINGEGNASMDVDVSGLAGDGAIKFEEVDALVAGALLRIVSAEIG